MIQGGPRGYFPYPTESILVFSDTNLARVESFFWWKVITIATVNLYLGVYIGGSCTQAQCLGKKVQDWSGGIWAMVVVTCKHLQAAYSSLQKSIQQELSFVQHATQGLGEDFQTVEKSLC